MKDGKEINALVRKLANKSKVDYEKKQKELAKLPDCQWCQTKLDTKEEDCKDCVKDKTSPLCKFKEVSADHKKLVTWAMMGSMIKNK